MQIRRKILFFIICLFLLHTLEGRDAAYRIVTEDLSYDWNREKTGDTAVVNIPDRMFSIYLK